MRIQPPVIAGNWKLNNGPEETRAFFRTLLPELRKDAVGTVAVFPPAISLAAAVEATAERPDVVLGVQNVYWEGRGAFTGEISAPLAREAGARMVLVGHSERRHIFGETTAETVQKVRAVLQEGLIAVLCVGETLEEREAGRAEEVVSSQLGPVVEILAAEDLPALLVAYEPVWAIGTGRTASPADASMMHRHARSVLTKAFAEAGAKVPLLYGGSVKPENAAELLAASDIDGLLIGGASLDPSSFGRICALRS
jgi:triosephosphate isomerase (TIM)